MNDFIMNIKNNPIYNNQKEGSIIGQGNFTFSEKLKSKTLATGDNNKLLLRPGTNKNGIDFL